jgi:hypothetical protein
MLFRVGHVENMTVEDKFDTFVCIWGWRHCCEIACERIL